MELYQILLIVFAVLVAALYIIQKFTGYNVLQKIVLTKPVISAVATAVQAVAKISGNEALKIIHVIMRAAAESAEFAEQAWLLGQIEKEKRNEYAKSIARNVCMKAGIELTDQVQMIISGIIEAVCVVLPHGVEPKVDVE